MTGGWCCSRCGHTDEPEEPRGLSCPDCLLGIMVPQDCQVCRVRSPRLVAGLCPECDAKAVQIIRAAAMADNFRRRWAQKRKRR